MDLLIQLREKKAGLVASCRTMNDKAEKEKRELTTEEEKEYDQRWKDVEKLNTRIGREERLVEAERALATTAKDARENTQARGEGDESQEARDAEYRAKLLPNLRTWMREGVSGLTPDQFRDLQGDVDIKGGYLVPPVQYFNQLIKFIDDRVFIRALATVNTLVGADSAGYPSLDQDPADADWTSELSTGNEDEDMAFGKRELKPHPLAKRIKISRDLIAASPAVETLVQSRLGYKFSVTQEKAFLTGHGAGQPLGVFTASDNGISTNRDISEDFTTTNFTDDGLVNVKYSLKAQYWPRARWMFHRDAIKKIAKLKNAEEQYIFQLADSRGGPDTLLGLPIDMSEFAPNTFTTGLYGGILADWSNYWIAEMQRIEMQRLVELYAETNQIGFIGRLKVDGMPVLEEAFARAKFA